MAYRDDDFTYPIFDQKVPKLRQNIELEGLDQNFIYALNFLSIQRLFRVRNNGIKLSLSHYDHHFASMADTQKSLEQGLT